MLKSNRSDSSDQSESMGRSDDEGSSSMKAPPPIENEADTSFLDDDFLSFEKDTTEKPGRKRSRSNSPVPYAQNNNNGKHSIPWLDESITPAQQPRQQSYNQSRGRGYGGNNYEVVNLPYHEPSALIKLHNEIVSFVKLMEPTREELEIRDKMVERVTDLANRVFGKGRCQVLPFGSQVTGLCLPNSDIDFVIRFTKKDATKGNNGKSKSEPIDLDAEDDEDNDVQFSNPLHAFAEAVHEEFGVPSDLDDSEPTKGTGDANDEYLSYLEVIEQTRVPLVKFTVEPYNIDIDVCFDQPGGPEAADLMHRFMNSMPPLRPLTFVLKYFLSSRDINKPFMGGIGSYLLQLMIVSFLQHRSREDLHRTGRLGNNYNLGSLLVDFFEFWGLDFNYVTTGISVRNDGFYFAKGERDKKKVFWQPSRQFGLAIENPLDTTMDVGGGAYRIQMIQRVFEHSFKTLLAYVSEPRAPTDSILAKIIPPTEEMAKRKALKIALGNDRAAATKSNNSNGGSDRQDHQDSRNKRKADRRDSGGSRDKDRNSPKKKKSDRRDSNDSRGKHKNRTERRSSK